MFGNMFEEEPVAERKGIPHAVKSLRTVTGSALAIPPAPRPSCGFAGLDNRGATCYMNALLQTLLFTPQFRDSLFALGPSELGEFTSKDKPGSKVRVIPIELQRLFGRLLLLDQQSVSTEALTNSFGWQNNEEFQQHDVQELNRILFSAIEDSLVGTAGQDLILHLYHGIIVNKITCNVCGRVSEREEDFLDLSLAVAYYSGLHDTLKTCYVDVEPMDGPNQYRCSRCDKLVDAIKSAKIRSLPAVLTVSLLRFSFDYQRCDRYKEIGRYIFPREIDMSPYCEKPESSDTNLYELYSVLIHSGSTHGGHYHAYIMDINGLGTWTKPEKDVIIFPGRLIPNRRADPTPSHLTDPIDVDKPEELLAMMLRKHGGPYLTMAIDKLCQAMSDETGVSWNKRFKKKCGSVTKFVRFHEKLFTYDVRTNCVTLKCSTPVAVETDDVTIDRARLVDGPPTVVDGETCSDCCVSAGGVGGDAPGGQSQSQDVGSVGEGVSATEQQEGESAIIPDETGRNQTVTPGGDHDCDPGPSSGSVENEPGTAASSRTDAEKPQRRWFDFNDSLVKPIDESYDVPRQYAGRESAYMLFYRRKPTAPTQTAGLDEHYGMPVWLVDEVKESNEVLAKQREDYDKALNRLELTILLDSHYEYRDGALHRSRGKECSEPTRLAIDRRRSVADLKVEIVKAFGDTVSMNNLCLHTAREVPAGLHLYDCITDNNSAILQDVNGLANGVTLFLWDGAKVDGMPIHTGPSGEPVLLHLTHAISRDNRETTSVSRGFAGDATVGELRALVGVQAEIPADQLALSRVVSDTAVLIRDEDDSKAIVAEMGMVNGDTIIAEYKRKGKMKSLAANEAARQSRLVSVTIENRCQPDHRTIQVEVDRDVTIGELKQKTLSQQDLPADNNGSSQECRLRISSTHFGLQPSLQESRTLAEAGISTGATLVLQPGDPPADGQITVNFSVSGEETSGDKPREVIVDRAATVQQMLDRAVDLAGLEANQWHLRRTNWLIEAGDILQDTDATLHQEGIANGDHLLLEPGRYPPKGFVRLPVWLYPSPRTNRDTESGILTWINAHLRELISAQKSPSTDVEGSANAAERAPLGEVELPAEATLSELKAQVQTLPAMSEISLPSSGFLRLRLVEGRRLGFVLRDGSQTLRRSKVTSASHIAVQILQEEEYLSVNMVVLDVRRRLPDSRTYSAEEELLLDTEKTASPRELRRVLADHFMLPVEHVAYAKHLGPKHEWFVIHDPVVENKPGKGRGKRKGKGGAKGGGAKGGGAGGGNKPKVNIKQPPYSLKDGDTIGVKDLRMDPTNQDDFSTEEDDAGKKALEKEIEDKRKRRQELKENNTVWVQSGRQLNQKVKKPEVGLSIRVGDFS